MLLFLGLAGTTAVSGGTVFDSEGVSSELSGMMVDFGGQSLKLKLPVSSHPVNAWRRLYYVCMDSSLDKHGCEIIRVGR